MKWSPALLLVMLLGCNKDPVAVARADNPEVPVAKLFERDGCTGYRFLADGRYRYFVRCGNERVSVLGSRTQSCVVGEGKE